MSGRLGLLLCLLAACWPAAQAGELAAPALAAELRKGGYVLYIRHTSTDFSRNDNGNARFEAVARIRLGDWESLQR